MVNPMSLCLMAALCGPRSNTTFRQQCSERVSQRVHVDRPAPLVTLRDASCYEVAVENANQTGRDGKQRRIERQRGLSVALKPECDSLTIRVGKPLTFIP